MLIGTSLVTLLLKNYYIIYLVEFYFLPSNKVKNSLVYRYFCFIVSKSYLLWNLAGLLAILTGFPGFPYTFAINARTVPLSGLYSELLPTNSLFIHHFVTIMLHRLMLHSQWTTRTSSGDRRIAPLCTLLHCYITRVMYHVSFIH